MGKVELRSPMRVAFLTPEYVTEVYFSGGLANYINRASAALAARGHDVHVLTYSELGTDDFMQGDVAVHRIGLGRTSRWLNKVTGERLRGTAEWIDLMVGVYRRVARLHRIALFDVIQAPNFSACGLVTTMLLPVPTVVRLSTYTKSG